MMKSCVVTFIGAVFLAASVGTLAHHSTRVFYDYDDDIEIEGRVTWVLWKNPHIRFNLTRTDDGGAGELWELEAGSVNTLERVGIGPETLQVDDVIRIAGPPSRRGLNSIYVSNVLFEDGREVSLQGNQRLRWTDDGAALAAASTEPTHAGSLLDIEGIFRVWSPTYEGRVQNYPFRPEAVEARENWDALNEDPALRCIPPGMPAMMDNPYPIAFELQGEDIVLRLEEWDGVRTIHMNSDADVASLPGSPMGYSVGRWEDGTLVVETAHINYPYFDSDGTPQSGQVEIVERFTVNDDETRLDHHMIVEDPATFTATAEMSRHYNWNPNEEIKLYECTLARSGLAVSTSIALNVSIPASLNPIAPIAALDRALQRRVPVL